MPEAVGLERFVQAQEGIYDQVLAELRAGRKATHWMWFIFPQLRVLGRSETARYYGLANLAEAQAYDRHPVLGTRLQQCAALLLEHSNASIEDIMGQVDALKLRSCATLFARASASPHSFLLLLATFYQDARCPLTAAKVGHSAGG